VFGMFVYLSADNVSVPGDTLTDARVDSVVQTDSTASQQLPSMSSISASTGISHCLS